MPKRYKTGKAQRAAVAAYRKRTPQKNFCVTVSEPQYNEDKSILTAHGLTTGKFWRWAIEKLKAEPAQQTTAITPPADDLDAVETTDRDGLNTK